MARFFRMGHTPGVMKQLPTLQPNALLHASPEFPYTLDLRRSGSTTMTG
jgi:hypothetical protein